MLDFERLLAKIDELDGYLKEIQEISPENFEEYKKIEKRRACERLLQVSIESMIDICAIIVSGLRLGLPAEEDDLFDKLEQAGIISPLMLAKLKKMRGFRNILVHEYGRINDELVYNMLKTQMNDFNEFKKEILKYITKNKH
ncbi:MAG: type VII toxin-antitoxin system HepT family RNase toxin [Acidobacteriota bacterium]